MNIYADAATNKTCSQRSESSCLSAHENTRPSSNRWYPSRYFTSDSRGRDTCCDVSDGGVARCASWCSLQWEIVICAAVECMQLTLINSLKSAPEPWAPWAKICTRNINQTCIKRMQQKLRRMAYFNCVKKKNSWKSHYSCMMPPSTWQSWICC